MKIVAMFKRGETRHSVIRVMSRRNETDHESYSRGDRNFTLQRFFFQGSGGEVLPASLFSFHENANWPLDRFTEYAHNYVH